MVSNIRLIPFADASHHDGRLAPRALNSLDTCTKGGNAFIVTALGNCIFKNYL
ncbi:MAG: hypothetical protein V4556_12485 [Bacteroidota bacterium]